MAALSGCAVGHIEHDARTEAEDAIPMIRDMWEETLGVDLYSKPFPKVTWHDVECLNHLPDPAFEFDGGCLLGRYNGTDDGVIDLVVPPSQRVSDSSLAHEMLHWALDMKETRPDPTHSGRAWDKVDEINDTLWEVDL